MAKQKVEDAALALERSLLRTNSTRKVKRSKVDINSSRRYADSSAVVKKVAGKGVVRISRGMYPQKSLDRIKKRELQSATEK